MLTFKCINKTAPGYLSLVTIKKTSRYNRYKSVFFMKFLFEIHVLSNLHIVILLFYNTNMQIIVFFTFLR